MSLVGRSAGSVSPQHTKAAGLILGRGTYKSTSECVTKWDNKSMFLSLSFPLSFLKKSLEKFVKYSTYRLLWRTDYYSSIGLHYNYIHHFSFLGHLYICYYKHNYSECSLMTIFYLIYYCCLRFTSRNGFAAAKRMHSWHSRDRWPACFLTVFQFTLLPTASGNVRLTETRTTAGTNIFRAFLIW